MKKSMLLAMVVVGLLGGSAWAAVGGIGTDDTGDVELKIDSYCSVVVGDAAITVADPLTGTANAEATCVVTANFAATITPTVVAFTGYTTAVGEKPDWVWTPTIDSVASKNVAAGVESITPVNVALSGVDLTDAVIGTFTKVATLTVTITPQA